MRTQYRTASDLSDRERLALREALDELSKPTYRGHDRRLTRLIAAYRSSARRGGSLPSGWLRLADLRLDVLTYRWGEGHLGGARPRIPLATYRPVAEVSGSGSGSLRIRFERVRVVDAASRRAMEKDLASARLALALHRSGERAGRGAWADGLALPRFSCDPKRSVVSSHEREPVLPQGLTVAGSLRSRLGARGPSLGLAQPGEDGIAAQASGVLSAHAAHLRGRALLNPALGVLARHGIVTPRSQALLGVELLRFRDALEDRLTSDPRLEDAIRQDLTATCTVAGVPFPEGCEGDVATEMLLSPWAPIERASAGRTLLVRLDGPPGIATASFAMGSVTIDLGDLGPANSALDGYPRGRARLAMGSRWA